jgi:hypothetical protein
MRVLLAGRARAITLGSVSLVAIALVASSVPQGNTMQNETRPECAHTFTGTQTIESIDPKRRAVRQPVRQIPVVPSGQIGLSGPITDIPEFHDCQRFIVRNPDGTTRYDSLFAIFARMELDKVFPDSAGLQPGSGKGSAWPPTAAATIVSYNGTYRPLGLKPGVSCLYLESDGTRWLASLTHNGRNGDCPDRLTGVREPIQLDVRTTPPPSQVQGTREVPPVARWDWDDRNHQQYIGIRCGWQYCEIGRSGFTPSPPLPVPTGYQAQGSHVFLVKGWYDDQILASPDLVAGRVVPSKMRGVVVPNPRLETLVANISINAAGDATNSSPWIDAAFVYVTDNDYANKRNIRQSWPPGAVRNVLRFRTRNMLEIWGMQAGPIQWRAETASPARRVDSRIIYRSMAGAISQNFWIPATARWRWKDTDEANWVACPLGCCEYF